MVNEEKQSPVKQTHNSADVLWQQLELVMVKLSQSLREVGKTSLMVMQCQDLIEGSRTD